jgi:hypothetical protein
MVRALGIAFAFLFTCSCALSLSPQVASDIVDYNEAASISTNKLLLLNILRARDSAPLMFSSVALIHGSIQMQGSATATFPFGYPPFKSVHNSLGLGLSTQTSPTFDVSSLDTQDFTRGILKPIDPAVVKYFLDRGEIDPKIIELLFFAEIDSSDGTVVKIDPEHTEGLQKALASLAADESGATGLIANAYDELAPVGGPLKLSPKTAIKDLETIDATKFRLRPSPKDDGTYTLYSVSAEKHVIFCLRIGNGVETRFVPLGAMMVAPSQSQLATDPKCVRDEIIVEGGRNHHTELSERRTFERVRIRSVDGIIQLLGKILRYEQAHGNQPLTFDSFIRGAAANEPSSTLFGQNTHDIIFQLSSASDCARFGVQYQGQSYYVCNQVGPNGVKDHTLEILALVSQLLNLNKSAKDLPVTQSVQIVP